MVITNADELKEGDVLNGIMYRRVLKENKNFIQVTTGSTGSGKSYKDLREIELWYKNVLKKPFPLENIQFSPEGIMERIKYYSNHPEEARGQILLYEEGGVGSGSLDFQNNVSKIFNYVMQSFRSMNIILFINLPYFSMLNKTIRMLAHFLMEAKGINNKQSIFKGYWLQYNQRTGDCYYHFPKVVIGDYYEQIEEICYNLPSDELRVPYEEKKAQFLKGLVSGGLVSMQDKGRRRLTPFQMQIYELVKQGVTNQRIIAEKIGTNSVKVCQNMAYMRTKGYMLEEIYSNKGNPAHAEINYDTEKEKQKK